jgi:uncharacterized repeat protein (TIGR01451 family)
MQRRATRSAPRRAFALLAAIALAAGMTVLGTGQASASVTTAFAEAFNTNANGSIVLRGNASLTCTACPTTQNGTAVGTNLNNNSFVMTNVDVDGVDGTFNSSSADVILPADSTVLFAGLYWSADVTAGAGGAVPPDAADKNQVKLRFGAGAYSTVTATEVSAAIPGSGAYQGFAEVTSTVLAAGNGTWTVADIQAATGQDRYAGWSLVIAYRNLSERMRNLVVYDGFGFVEDSPGEESLDIAVSGFQTPSTGTVTTKIGTIVYEGDSGLVGDSLELDGAALSDAQNPVANFFNSTVSDAASAVTARNPAYTNLMGVDIDQYDASSLLANNATSATLTLTTGGETFFPGVVTFSTDLYSPLLNATLNGVDVDGGDLLPGDVIEYTFLVTNDGTDDAIKSVLSDAVPSGTTYVPGSMTIAGVSRTDTAGDDPANFTTGTNTFRLGTGADSSQGGELAPNATVSLTYRVRVNLNTPGGATVLNVANLSYEGKHTGSLNANPSASAGVTVVAPVADLEVTADVTPTTVQRDGVNDPVTYDLTVLNNGPDLDPGATVALTLPAGVTAGALPGGCSAGGQTVTCVLGDIASAASVQVAIPAVVSNTAAFASVATAVVTGTGGDPTPANNTDTAALVVNTEPVAVADVDSTTNGTLVIVDVLGNDSDPDTGDTPQVSQVDAGSHGTTSIDAGGGIRYTPTLGYAGMDYFAYTLVDDHGGSTTAMVAVTVLNAAPTAVDDAIATGADTTVAVPVLGNDTDPNTGHTLVVDGVTQGANGTVTITNGGLDVTYDPDPAFAGDDTFTYTVSDGNGGTDTATVTATVNGGPAASDDVDATGYDQTAAIDVLGNDTDPNGDALTVVGVTQGDDGTVTITNGGLDVTYDPDPGFSGDDTFTYTVSDGNGGSDTATVTVTVANAPPVADDQVATTGHHQATVVNVLTGDTDPNDDTLDVSGLSAASHGLVVDNGDGTVTYTPVYGYAGTDSFDYTITDNHGGTDTGTVTVTVTNAVPVAADDTAPVEVSQAQIVDVLDNDLDPNGGLLTVTILTQPAHGTATLNPDRTITYTPDADYEGGDSFTYAIEDADNAVDSATVTLSVVNSPPDANPDAELTPTDTPVTVLVLDNDTDPGNDPLTVSAFTQGAHGTVTRNPAKTELTYTPDGGYAGPDTFTYQASDGRGGLSSTTVTITVQNAAPVAVDDALRAEPGATTVLDVAANDTDLNDDVLGAFAITSPPGHGVATVVAGKIEYTPAGGYHGPDSFAYTVEDGNGGVSGSATVTLDVNAAPSAVDDAGSTPTDADVVIDVVGNDTDPEDDARTVASFTDPAHGSVVLNPARTEFTYTPDAGWTGADTFTYRVTDPSGGISAPATVTVTVDNAPPVAVADGPFSIDPDTFRDLDVVANDTDPNTGQTLVVTVHTQPAHGTATVVAGTIRYTPDAGYKGADSFTYTVSDGTASDDGTVSVVVSGAAPVATADSRSTNYLKPITVDVLDNDTDPNGDTLTVGHLTLPKDGTGTTRGTAVVTGDDEITYTPPTTFSGVVTFSYTIDDGDGGEDTALVTITVGPAPAVPNEKATAKPGAPVSIGLPTVDKNGRLVTVVDVGDPKHGTVTLNSDGSVTYTPEDGFVGTDSFRYWVEDEDGNRASALVSVTVAAAGSKPVADNERRSTKPGEPIVINVLAGDTDPDGDPLTVSKVTQPVHGSVQINSDGTVTYTPDAGYKGTDTFTYTLSDGTGNTDSGTVTVTVSAESSGGSLPRTGTDVFVLAQAGLLVLLGGTVLVFLASRGVAGAALAGAGRHRPAGNLWRRLNGAPGRRRR